MNSNWNETCPVCQRKSLTLYPTGMARCNRCWHLSTKRARWLAGHESVLGAIFIAVVVFAAGAVWYSTVHADEINLTTIDTGSIRWTTGRVGDDTVNLLENGTDTLRWTSGTIGDDSVNLLENRSDDWSWTTGTIGDDNVSVTEFDWDNDD